MFLKTAHNRCDCTLDQLHCKLLKYQLTNLGANILIMTTTACIQVSLENLNEVIIQLTRFVYMNTFQYITLKFMKVFSDKLDFSGDIKDTYRDEQ